MAAEPSNLGNKVNVVIRSRPLIHREKNENATNNWYMDSKMIQKYQPGTTLLSTSPPYAFDYIFGQQAKTDEVYQKVVAPIVEKSLQGFNGTVLCYGQTSWGKTFTMYGNDDEPGIIFLTAQDLFRRFEEGTRSYFVRIGLLEVYNEKLTDLLDEKKKAIDIKEVKGEVFPKDLREIDCYSPEDMLEAARHVQQERRKGETLMNKESSRSHTILRILIQSVANEESEDTDAPQVTNALLNFVDLAGSEKAEQTGAVGYRLKEAGYINKSLFTLSQVVNQLSGQTSEPNPTLKTNSGPKKCGTATGSRGAVVVPQGAKQVSKTQPFVSYRDSKLTRILQSSLSGNAYIALICNVTPATVEETHSTLRFANRAKCIKVDPTKNLGPATASEYKSKIRDLENQLNGKSSEMDRLRKQLTAMQKFVKPLKSQNVPATFHSEPDRRRTMCPSLLFTHRSAVLFPSVVTAAATSSEPRPQAQELFPKTPDSPNRCSLMPTTVNNPPHQLDLTYVVNPNLSLSTEYSSMEPPPAKISKVDAQTSTRFATPPPLGLQAGVSEKSIQLEELSSKCEELEAELKEVRANKERLESEKEILRKNLLDTKSRNRTIMSDYERLQEENISKTEFLSEIQDELGQLRTKLQESEEALLAAKAKAAEESEWEDWQSKYDALLLQMNVLREENDGTNGALTEIKTKLTEAEAKLEAQSKENTEAVKKYDSLMVWNQELEIELETVRMDKDRVKSELAQCATSLAALQMEKDDLSADMAELLQEKRKQGGEILNLDLDMEEIILKNDQRLAKLRQLAEFRKKQVDDLKKDFDDIASSNSRLNLMLSNTRQAKNTLRAELEGVRETLAALESAQSAAATSTQKHDALLAQRDILKAEFQTHMGEWARLKVENEQVQLKYETAFSMLSQVEAESERVQKLKDKLQAQLDCGSQSSSQELSLLRTERDELQSQMSSLHAELEVLQVSQENLHKDKQRVSTELNNVQGQLKAAGTFRQSIETELQACQKALEEVQTSFYKEKSNSQALKTANEDLTQHCAKLSASCDSLQKAHSALQSTLDQANQANVTLQEKIKAFELQAGEASAGRPRPKLRSTQFQQIAERQNYLRGKAENELQKIQKDLKILQQQVAKLEADKAELLTSVVQFSEETEHYKELIKRIPQTVETETQCTLMDEIFKDSKIKPVGPLPSGWPDLHAKYNESRELRIKVSVLEEAKAKCTCSTPASSQSRPSSYLPYTIDGIAAALSMNRAKAAPHAAPARHRAGTIQNTQEHDMTITSTSSSPPPETPMRSAPLSPSNAPRRLVFETVVRHLTESEVDRMDSSPPSISRISLPKSCWSNSSLPKPVDRRPIPESIYRKSVYRIPIYRSQFTED